MRHKPVFGKQPFGRRDGRLILIAYFDPNGIETIPEGIASWQSLSRHEIQLLNLWPGREGRLRLPEDLDFRAFEGIIFHPTISYFPHVIRGLDVDQKIKISEYDGVKILMKQDEQVQSGKLGTLVADLGFDVVFSCLPEDEHEKVYPRAVIGKGCEIFRTLTGYVSPKMRHTAVNRAKDLGVTYRGSIQPLEFGRLGYEKRGIGYDMAEVLSKLPDIAWDISSNWENRLTGSAWEEFLGRSNIVLGVESGSNIFDFDGSVANWCRDYSKRFEGEDHSSYEYYIRAHNEFLHRVEGNVNYAQISPRHFEAAAAGAAQLLYEGLYSNIFIPGDHFYPLKRNMENLDAVIDFIRDDLAQATMASRTFDEVILNPQNWYESFVSATDRLIDKKLVEKGFRSPSPTGGYRTTRPSAFILCAQDPRTSDRVGSFAKSLGANFDVTVICTYNSDQTEEQSSNETLGDGIHLIKVERTCHEMDWVPNAGDLLRTHPTEARLLLSLVAEYARLPRDLINQKLGGVVATDSEIERFRSICENMVSTNSALLNVVSQVGAPNLIVAVNLDTLFSAAICKETLNVPIVFDAQEYWPYSYTDFQHWEIEFWSAMEGRLSQLTAINIAVTPQLTDIMMREYSTQFRALPNAARLSDCISFDLDVNLEQRRKTGRLQVLYQGVFAEGNGLEEMINAWAHVNSDSVLVLQGLYNEYSSRLVDLARNLGLDENKIAFVSALDKHELTKTASSADIGIIPYNPKWFRQRHCCPVELSQYAAIGLPILTSCTEFVSEIVQQNKIGFVIDISAPNQIAHLIDELSENRLLLLETGVRARNFFEKSFNWEALGREIFEDIALLCKNAEIRRPALEGIGRQQPNERNLGRHRFGIAPSLDREVTRDNVLVFDRGARVVSSSSFAPFPHDAGYILRGSGTGYSAALETTSLEHWIEFELAEVTSVSFIKLVWLDRDNRATSFRVLLRDTESSMWSVVVDEVDAQTEDCFYGIVPTRCRSVRIETSSYVGQQRMLLRRFELIRSSAVASEGSTLTVSGSHSSVAQEYTYKTIGPNLLSFEAGATVVASSAFCDWPNDPGYVLRNRASDGYAAGVSDTENLCWIEFSLAQSSLINAACVEWYSDENRAVCYRLLSKKSKDDPWEVMVDESSAEKAVMHYGLNEIVAKFIRIETSEYKGQPRMLLRRFELFYGLGVKAGN